MSLTGIRPVSRLRLPADTAPVQRSAANAICQLAAQGIGRSCMCPTDYVTDTGMPELRSLMGVQLGFMGVQLGCKVILGCFAGAAAAVRGLPGSSGRLSPCLPDDGGAKAGTGTLARRGAPPPRAG